MITPDGLGTLLDMAGAEYGWEGYGSRPMSSPARPIRQGLRRYIRDYAGGLCVFCGEATVEADICHIVSGGPDRRGWVAPNLANGCRDCNEIDRDHGRIVPLSSIVRPDLVPGTFPSLETLIGLGRDEAAEVAGRKARKRVRRYG